MTGAKAHFAKEALEAYVDGRLPLPDMLRAEEHLADCDLCYAQLRGDERLGTLYSATQGELGSLDIKAFDCISYEQLAAFVNHDYLDAEDSYRIEAHFACCEVCADLAHSLSRIRDTVLQASVMATPQSVWQRLKKLARSPRFWLPAELAGAGAGAAGALLVMFLVNDGLKTRITDLGGEVAQLKQANAVLQVETAGLGDLRERIAAQDAEIAGMRELSSDSGFHGDPITVNDGGRRIVLDTQGNLSGFGPIAPTYQTLVREALTLGRVRLVVPSLSGPGPFGGRRSFSSEDETFRLGEPTGVVLLTEHPTFRWDAVPGAERYVVLVRDITSKMEIESDATAETHWTPTTALARGHVYSWGVEATREGRRIQAPSADAPEPRFKVVEGGVVAELDRAKRTSRDSHLLMGALYAKHGLLEYAERELALLRAENPESPMVKRLVNSLKSRRR